MDSATNPKSDWRGPLLIFVATIGMLAWSWQTWCDPLVDFGKQLYLPWQMTQGKALYRDMAYYSGPLSQYINAEIFARLGPSLRILVVENLAVLAGVLILIYRIANRASGPTAAILCPLTFVLLFAFGQGVGVANFNWVTPYTIEITHGIAMGMLAIATLGKFQRSGKHGWLIAAGVLVGLTFLTRPEPFLAIAAASIAMLAAGAWMTGQSAARVIKDLLMFFAASIAVPLLAWGLMSLQMPANTAALGVAGAWPWLFDARVTALPFYRRIAGTDDLASHLLAMLRWSLVYGAAVGGATFVSLRIRKPSRATAIIIFVIAITSLTLGHSEINWGSIISPLPICLLVVLVASTTTVIRRTMTVDRAVIRIGVIVFAIALLSKIALNAGIAHYGFALAMPGVLLMVAAVFEDLPRWVRSRGGDGGLLRAIGAAGWIAAVVVTLYVDQTFFAPKQWTLGTNGDAFRVDHHGLEIGQLIEQIQRLTPQHSTLAVLPQGLMVNYLARRANSIPQLNFMPPEVLAAGEDRIIAALLAHPPDAIVIDTGSVDGNDFTMDQAYRYGHNTLAWVRKNYRPVSEPNPGRFVLMKRD